MSSWAEAGGNGSNGSVNETTLLACDSATPYLVPRFYLVSVFGSLLAGVAILESLLLMWVLFTRPIFRRSYFVYFGALAVADLLVGIGYVAVIAVSMIFEFYHDVNLMHIWVRFRVIRTCFSPHSIQYSYVIAATTISQVSLLVPPYLLLAASLERYLSVLGLSNLCTSTARLVSIAGLLHFLLLQRTSPVKQPREPSKCEVNFSSEVYRRQQPTWLAMLRLIVPKMKGSSLQSGSPRLRNDLFTNSFDET